LEDSAIRIVGLRGRADVHDQTAALMRVVWPEYYGPDGPGDAVGDLRARSRPSGLPYGVVAVDAKGDVVGTGALAQTSFGKIAGEELWLVGLCVAPQKRGLGIASGIVAHLERQARRDGCGAIHATTRDATGLFKRRGWRVLRQVSDAQGVWQVMGKDLAHLDES
jgi:GNAT superfamily N-acetyltransferase